MDRLRASHGPALVLTWALLPFLLPLAARAADPPFFPEKLREIDAAIAQNIADHKLPGAVFWLERNGAAYHKAYGQRALEPQPEPMTEETIFDAASLTKVVATTPAILLLVERRQIQLDDPAQKYLPEFKGDGKEGITVRHLLTHTSGLRPDLDLKPAWTGYTRALELAAVEKPVTPPGSAFRYSDINFFVLGEIVQRVAGAKLEEWVKKEVYQPLTMNDTGFLPDRGKTSRIAPTEKVDGEILRGQVHDPTARRMGGVAGHAGLFTTAADLARFARMMLGEGALEGIRVFQPETVRLMTSVQSPPPVEARRGLGWDIDSAFSRPRGKIFPLGSYGHTGFTGTCLWIDPFSKTFWIFLSNRVHPDGKGNVLPLEAQLANLAAEAVPAFNFAYVPGSLAPQPAAPASSPERLRAEAVSATPVLNGIDVLVRDQFAPLKGLKLGLITNHTGTDRRRRSTIDLLKEAPGVELKALFSPEHGIRGDLDDKVGDSVDARTGLPVYSLYGENRQPKPAQLEGLDALVFDIQDIGCRFYTYISTMGLALEAAARSGLRIFILDRVNPINGAAFQGPVLTGEPNFTGFHRLPVRHGMTVGELAQMFNLERQWRASLTVVPIQGWRRNAWFDQTGLPWTNPSPNMRSLNEAALYPGIGLLETTALSVGRGTDTPFEVIGAPYIDDLQFATELNRAGLAGVRFVPVRFKPAASTFRGEVCGGANILLTDREKCEVIDLGITIAQTLHRLYPHDFKVEKMNALLRHPPTIEAIVGGKSLAEIKKLWEPDLESFAKRRKDFLLYD